MNNLIIVDQQVKLVDSGSIKNEELNTPTWIGPYEIKEYLSKYHKIESTVKDELTQMADSLHNLINDVKEYYLASNPLLLICSNGKKTYSIGGIRVNKNNDEIEVLILDPHFSENVKKNDYLNYYSNNEFLFSEEDNKEILERKQRMIKESLRWESATKFFTYELYWSVLFPKCN